MALPSPATLTPMMAQYVDIKQQHPDCVVLFRLGDFYEIFFDDAAPVAQALGIQLTRRAKQQGEDIPMCGIPWHQLDVYLPQLITKGFRVALCEQTETPEQAKKRGGVKALVSREVVRIITPGTLTEEGLLPARNSNYLAAVACIRQRYGISWLDLSTGAFHCTSSHVNELPHILARISPTELLIPEKLRDTSDVFDIWRIWKAQLVIQPDSSFTENSASQRLHNYYQVATLDGFGQFTPAELAASGALLDYVRLTQKTVMPRLQPLQGEQAGQYLRIDAATRRNLELTATSSGSYHGSLLSILDDCASNAGSRTLRQHLSAPLLDVAAIEQRLDAVSFFVDHPDVAEAIYHQLKSLPDMERCLARLALNRGGPRDLAAIRDGFVVAERVRAGLNAHPLPPLLLAAIRSIPQALPVTATLSHALADDLPLFARDGGFIRHAYHPPLDDILALKRDGKTMLLAMQSRYIQETGIAKLKISHNNLIGYHIEITARDADKVPAHFQHRQSMVNALRYTTPELLELQQKLLQADERISAMELELFLKLQDAVLRHDSDIRITARSLASIDVAINHARLAIRHKYCRPQVDTSTTLAIDGGRHPVVEQLVHQHGINGFAANDCIMHTESHPAGSWLITGPNMAGKSTFLRQTALIALLAQTGCYVPAHRAHIGIVDSLFSRVGAADDLAQGRSTFMVEMVETAAIVHQATARSLVILDEIGRGTATYDGLSLAWAVLEHLTNRTRARTLFASHYHELTAAVAQSEGRIANYTLAIDEQPSGIAFLYKVCPGAAKKSYGLYVAKLAGMPESILARAGDILQQLERQAQPLYLDSLPLFSQASIPPITTAANDNPDDHRLAERLKQLQPDQLSPREALDALYELQAMLSS